MKDADVHNSCGDERKTREGEKERRFVGKKKRKMGKEESRCETKESLEHAEGGRDNINCELKEKNSNFVLR